MILLIELVGFLSFFVFLSLNSFSIDSCSIYDTDIFKGRLSDKSVCMEGRQDQGKYRHYDVHSLYGWSQAPPTLQLVVFFFYFLMKIAS